MSPRVQKPVQRKDFAGATEALEWVAREVCGLIRMKAFQRARASLAFAPCSGFESLLAELVEHSGVAGHGGLDYRKVDVLTCCELAGRGPDDEGSVARWLAEGLVRATGTPGESFHPLDGRPDGLEERCAAWEERLGPRGISLVFLTLGPAGELGLLPPGTPADSVTGLVRPTPESAEELARALGTAVPEEVVHVGLATLSRAERVRILALGEAACAAAARVVASDPDPALPASLLFGHKDCTLLAAPEAG